MTSLIPSPCHRMDDIVLKPHLSCGICWQDRKTGLSGKEKSLHLSTTTTLWNMLVFLFTLCLAAKGMMWLCRKRSECKMRKKYRQKWQKAKAKMSKS